MFHLEGADHAHQGARGQGAVLVLSPGHRHEHLRVFILPIYSLNILSAINFLENKMLAGN